MISFTGDFTADFDAVLRETEPFALVRFGDGEHTILAGKTYRAKSDGWVAPPGSWVARDLAAALEADLPGYCVGLPAPCCLSIIGASLRRRVAAPRSQVTHSMLFGNANYARIGELVERFAGAAFVTYGPNATIEVPQDGVSTRWDLDRAVSQMQAQDRPILLAAGPCAKILVHRYWLRQAPERRQIVLDVGAALNPHLHGRGGRAYHAEGKFRSHACSFTAAPGNSKTPGARRSRPAPTPLSSTTTTVARAKRPPLTATTKGRPMPATLSAARRVTPRPTAIASTRTPRPKPVPITSASTPTSTQSSTAATTITLPNTAPSKGSNRRGCLSCMKRQRAK